MISLSATCLALAIYYESRNQPVLGQKYTAHVVMNRAEKNDTGVCESVFAKNQFSWTRIKRLKSKKTKIEKVTEAKRMVDDLQSWQKAETIASSVMSRQKDITHGAIYFNTKQLGKRFRTKSVPVVLGNHIYY